MFAAYLAGDAIGNVTPFGLLASEPSKIVMIRRRIALPASVAALTVENLVYSATAIMMLLTGTAALLLSFALPRSLRIACLAVLFVAPLVAVAAAWIIATRRRVVSASIEWLVDHRIAASYLSERLPHVRQTGDRMVGLVLLLHRGLSVGDARSEADVSRRRSKTARRPPRPGRLTKTQIH
jgi:hypothetical protein